MSDANSRDEWIEGEEWFAAASDATGKLRKRVHLRAEDWDDVMTAVMISLSQHRAELAKVVNRSAYAYAVVRNETVRVAKANQKRKAVEQARGSHGGAPVASADDPSIAAINRESLEQLATLMGELDETDREIVRLWLDGVSFARIGEIVRVSPTTAWNVVHRFLDRARRMVA